MSEREIRSAISDVFSEIADALENGSFTQSGPKIRVGLTVLGSEHGTAELVRGAELAQSQNPDLQVVVIGSGAVTHLELVEAADEKAAHSQMDQMLLSGQLDAAVTMHYNFPIGVSTVGKVITPARGREMFLACTTGTSATERVTAMLKNTICGIATAKACGIKDPTVGILNIDGARQVERCLKKLQDGGYPIHFTESARADGGLVMRGNDLLLGVPDVMVNDSLTGNVMMKVFSAFTTGGSYEALGYGYGPGVGEAYDRIICIISRASGAPVIAGAIRLAADCAKGKLMAQAKAEFALAKKAGWEQMIAELTAGAAGKAEPKAAVIAPAKKPVTDSIPGVEVMDLEDAVQAIWQVGIYAESGMGCTGPIVMIAPEDTERALIVLKECKYL